MIDEAEIKRSLTRRQALLSGGTLAGALSVSGFLAACGSVSNDSGKSSSGGSTEKDLRIGAVMSLSGAFANYEQPSRAGLLLGVAAVNAKGGVGGRQIKIIERDTRSDAATALQQARKAVLEDKVDLIFGVAASNLLDAVLPFATKSKVALIHASPYEGGLYSDYFFSLGMTPSQTFNVDFLKSLREKANGRRVYYIGSDYAFPRKVGTYLSQYAYPQADLEPVGSDYVPFTQTNVAPNLSKLLAAKPDIVINNVVADSGISLQRAIGAQGAGDAAVWAGAAYGQSTVGTMGKDANGARGCFSWVADNDSPASKELVSGYNARVGGKSVATDFTESSYNTAFLLQAAANVAKSSDTAAIVAALPGTKFTAPSGEIEVREDHHMVLNGYVAEAANGNLKTISAPTRTAPVKDQREKGSY